MSFDIAQRRRVARDWRLYRDVLAAKEDVPLELLGYEFGLINAHFGEWGIIAVESQPGRCHDPMLYAGLRTLETTPLQDLREMAELIIHNAFLALADLVGRQDDS